MDSPKIPPVMTTAIKYIYVINERSSVIPITIDSGISNQPSTVKILNVEYSAITGLSK